jgi:hypothetical protein
MASARPLGWGRYRASAAFDLDEKFTHSVLPALTSDAVSHGLPGIKRFFLDTLIALGRRGLACQLAIVGVGLGRIDGRLCGARQAGILSAHGRGRHLHPRLFAFSRPYLNGIRNSHTILRENQPNGRRSPQGSTRTSRAVTTRANQSSHPCSLHSRRRSVSIA